MPCEYGYNISTPSTPPSTTKDTADDWVGVLSAGEGAAAANSDSTQSRSKRGLEVRSLKFSDCSDFPLCNFLSFPFHVPIALAYPQVSTPQLRGFGKKNRTSMSLGEGRSGGGKAINDDIIGQTTLRLVHDQDEYT